MIAEIHFGPAHVEAIPAVGAIIEDRTQTNLRKQIQLKQYQMCQDFAASVICDFFLAGVCKEPEQTIKQARMGGRNP